MKRWMVGLAVCVLLGAIGFQVVDTLPSAAKSEQAGPGEPGLSAAELGMTPLECPPTARAVRTRREQFCVIATAGKAVRHGPAARWSEDAPPVKQAEGEYRNGQRHGTWTEWHPSGSRSSELQFIEGKGHGPFQRWFDDGALQSEGEYLDGEQHGPWVHYFEDGRKAEAGDYWMGKRQGTWTGWHASGRKQYSRLYTANHSDQWTEWDETGTVVNQSPR